jgi:hypothetical protein
MTTTANRLIIASALASSSIGAMAHSIDISHTHSPDGLTLVLLASGAFLCSVTLAALLVWHQRRQPRSRA